MAGSLKPPPVWNTGRSDSTRPQVGLLNLASFLFSFLFFFFKMLCVWLIGKINWGFRPFIPLTGQYHHLVSKNQQTLLVFLGAAVVLSYLLSVPTALNCTSSINAFDYKQSSHKTVAWDLQYFAGMTRAIWDKDHLGVSQLVVRWPYLSIGICVIQDAGDTFFSFRLYSKCI